MWSPSQLASTRAAVDSDVERELDTLERVLREHGEMTRSALGELAGCRFWGPGRFSRALRTGVARGTLRRVGRNRYAAG
jgi:hypothetical protein